MEIVRNSRDAVQILYPVIYDLDHEEAWVIFLSAGNKVLSMEMLSKGTLTQTPPDYNVSVRTELIDMYQKLLKEKPLA